MNQEDDTSGGTSWRIPALVWLILACAVLYWGMAALSGPVKGGSLPVIILGGVVLLIVLLAIVTLIFSMLGLTNKDMAMGLPDGSIRAVIALSLIVLFSTCSVYLFKGISEGGRINTIGRMTDEDRQKFLREHANLPDLQSAISKGDDEKEIIAKDATGKELHNADGSPKYLYDVTYSGTTNAASLDFAKQLLTLLGTLMTAITSFYLGAGTVTSATAVAQAAGTAQPTIAAIDPSSFAISEGTFHLKISGANLNPMTNAKIVRGDATIFATNVQSNATQVSCDLNVGKATAGAWNIIVDNGASLQASLQNALMLT